MPIKAVIEMFPDSATCAGHEIESEGGNPGELFRLREAKISRAALLSLTLL
jgi:hypothetical protein